IGTERFHEIEIGAVGPCAIQTLAHRHLVPFIGANFCADGIERRLWNVDFKRLWHGGSGSATRSIRQKEKGGNAPPFPMRLRDAYFASSVESEDTQPSLPSSSF